MLSLWSVIPLAALFAASDAWTMHRGSSIQYVAMYCYFVAYLILLSATWLIFALLRSVLNRLRTEI